MWPEILRAGTPASGLYARCGSYIADNTTDGYIPAEVVSMYGTREWAAKLVDVGLWKPHEDGGYIDTRYFPLNPDRETVDKRRQAAADRAKRYRAKKKPDSVTPASRVTDASRHAQVTPPPARPPSGGRGAGAREAPAHGCPHGTPGGSDLCAFCRRGLDERPGSGYGMEQP